MPFNNPFNENISKFKKFNNKKINEKNKEDKKIIFFKKIDDDTKEILTLFVQMPFLNDMVANLFIEKYFEKDKNILNYFKSLLYLTNIDSEFWTIKEWIKKEIKYKEFKYNILNSLIKEFISKQQNISRSQALKYLLIQSRILLYIEDEAKTVTNEFHKAIKESNDNIKIMEIVDNQLEEFINLSKDNKSEAMREAYFLKAKFLRRKREFDKAKEYFQKVIKFSQEDEIKAESCQLLGYILYKNFHKKHEAIKLLNRSIKILETTNNNFLEAKTYSILGNIYKDNFKKAKKYFTKSLKIEQKNGNKKGEAKVLHDLGLTYLKTKNREYFDETKKYLDKSLNILIKERDKKGIAQVLHDIGRTYYELGKNFNKAKEYFDKSIKAGEKIENKKEHKAKVLQSLGMINYELKKDLNKAEEYFNKSLNLKEEIDDKIGQIITLGKLGELYYQKNNFTKAKKYYKEGLKICKKREQTTGPCGNIIRKLDDLSYNFL